MLSWKSWHKNCFFTCHVFVFSLWSLNNKNVKLKSFMFSEKTFNSGRGKKSLLSKPYRFTSCPDLVACITLSFSSVDDHWNASTQQQVLVFIYFHLFSNFPSTTCLFGNMLLLKYYIFFSTYSKPLASSWSISKLFHPIFLLDMYCIHLVWINTCRRRN